MPFPHPLLHFARDYSFGNHIKSINLSVDASLKKLRTSYVDILCE